MSEDNKDIEVGAVRVIPCAGGSQEHVESVRTKDMTVIDAENVMTLMDAGKTFFMIPPEGAPAYEAYKATGLPIVLQTIVCPDCKERVLFA